MPTIGLPGIDVSDKLHFGDKQNSKNKKLSCRRETARCFVFVVSFNIPTARFFITSYCGFRFTSA